MFSRFSAQRFCFLSFVRFCHYLSLIFNFYQGHEPLVLLVPGANPDLLQQALERAYTQNSAGNLETLLGLVLDLPCNHCDQRFQSYNDIEAHNCKKRPNFSCNICGKLINSSSQLESHICANSAANGGEQVTMPRGEKYPGEPESEENAVLISKKEPPLVDIKSNKNSQDVKAKNILDLEIQQEPLDTKFDLMEIRPHSFRDIIMKRNLARSHIIDETSSNLDEVLQDRR